MLVRALLSMLAESATALSPKLARPPFSKFTQLMVGTCFVACLCQSDLPELASPEEREIGSERRGGQQR